MATSAGYGLGDYAFARGRFAVANSSNLGAVELVLPRELVQAINAIHAATPNPK